MKTTQKPGTILWIAIWFFLSLVLADLALDELARTDYWYVQGGAQ